MKNLPQELTTVTSLSKGLAVIVFIVTPFIGFLMGISYQQKIDLANQQPTVIYPLTTKISPTPIVSIPSNKKVVGTFFIHVISSHTINNIGLSPNDNNKHITLPIGSTILMACMGNFSNPDTYIVTPPSGAVQFPKVPTGAPVYLPMHDCGIFATVKEGDTIITVLQDM